MSTKNGTRLLGIATLVALHGSAGCVLGLDDGESDTAPMSDGPGDDSTGNAPGTSGASNGTSGTGDGTSGTSGTSDGTGDSDGSDDDATTDGESADSSGGEDDTGTTGDTEPPSCAALDDTMCNGESCCTALPVEVGEVVHLTVNGPDATVSAFALDKYEVNVGRFRAFVSAYDAWRAGNPQAGAAESPNAPGTGWQADPLWEGNLAASEAVLREALQCSDTYETWTNELGPNETLPINCVSWYEAFAFCAWDGGRLPTEVEWAYAAIGGAEDREYPWGDTDPTADFAAYNCLGAGTSQCSFDDILAVGSRPNGEGRWGHLDLAGSMEEWALDWRDVFPEEVDMDYVNLEPALYRVTRGGSWSGGSNDIQANRRTDESPDDRGTRLGLRCARDP